MSRSNTSSSQSALRQTQAQSQSQSSYGALSMAVGGSETEPLLPTQQQRQQRQQQEGRSLLSLGSRRQTYIVGLSVSLLTIAGFTGMFLMFWTQGSVLQHGRDHGLVTSNVGVVATENILCSQIGVQVLKDNGSAVDAAVAAGLCIGVTNMYSSGIGGGGFMLVRNADGSSEAIDFREEAPKAAFKDMYVTNPKLAQSGGLSVGVPGELYGLYEAHRKYGKLPWSRLVKPSVDLCRDGWRVSTILETKILGAAELMLADPTFASVFAPNGRLLRAGNIIRRPSYATTLESIAKDGIEPFYKGWIADELVKTVTAAGGILTHADLEAYRPKLSPPYVGTYRGRKVITTPPPTSGAVLLSALNILEGYEFDKRTPLNTHRLVEAWKYGYAQRSLYGDPIDPIYRNISEIARNNIRKETAAAIRANLSDSQTYDPSHYQTPFDVKSDHGTMHLSILTADDQAVSMTSTINLVFGARLMDPVTGIILNDQMDDFSIPGVPNFFGLSPSPYNFIHPGKRPLSSSVPTIVEKDGLVQAVAGASGGSLIITSTMQTLIGMLDWDLTPAQAVHLPRSHHQLVPNKVTLEDEFDVGTARELEKRGHELYWLGRGVYATGVQAVKRLADGTLQAASDARKGGIAAAV
ncbi:gamma-glutamyltranspeptidase-domain-containing protein [Entophlyctis helioformis]|nr:gamma-glutamyltranspeptidase-domain-containing protein [Entophlyctis helioformis]